MNKDQIYMNIAKEYSNFSKCQFTQVAAILVNEQGRIVSTGVNGTVPGTDNCCDIKFDSRDDHGKFSHDYEIHAEMNLMLELIRNGVQLEGEHTIYVTISPCGNCLKHIAATNSNKFKISKIVYEEQYWRTSDEELVAMMDYAYSNGIQLLKLDHIINF
jgi:dCMP deaminase